MEHLRKEERSQGFNDVPDSVKLEFPANNVGLYSENMLTTYKVFGRRCSILSGAASARKWVERNALQYKRLRK